MLKFYHKYKTELTESEIVLIDDIWLNPKEPLLMKVNKKWAQTFSQIDRISEAVNKELTSKRNETLRNQELLLMAELYRDKAVY